MDKIESLEKNRLVRISNSKALLGEPDLLTILKTTTVNSFLSTRKTCERQQNFVYGLNFPTTAHFSSFINSYLNPESKTKNQITYKIRLFMYDIFNNIDYVIEINIPGSLEIKAFRLNGQPINFEPEDYDSAYYSSIIRSLYPKSYYWNTKIYGQVEKFQVLSTFFKAFLPFAIENPLEVPEDMLEVQNIIIELLINYVKSYSLTNLCLILIQQLQNLWPQRALILSLQLKQKQGQYNQIVIICAQHLLNEDKTPEINQILSEFQLRALCKLKKVRQARAIGDIFVRKGFDDLETWEQLLKIHLDEDNDKVFFKVLNTAVSLSGEDELFSEKANRILYPKKMSSSKLLFGDQRTKRSNQISEYPQFIFKFDYDYLQSETNVRQIQQALQKSQKERPTSDMLHRLDMSYQKQSFFQKFVAVYEKQKGWNKLIQQRALTFWLQNDYEAYQNELRKKNHDMSYRFINESFTKSQKKARIKQNQEQVVSPKNQNQNEESQTDPKSPSSKMDSSFNGDFSQSESEDQKQSVKVPNSKRITTKRVGRDVILQKSQYSKVLCHYSLEKIFLLTYNNLKLSADIENWTSKLNIESLGNISKQKRELISLVFLKKGFFNKNIHRYRKSQQAYKIARKCSPSTEIDLVACYSLAKLYLQHNNIKGVEYYTVEIVRILYSLGVEKYEYVPLWAKQIIPYIIKNYGKAIVKRLQDPLKDIIILWLQIDHKNI